MNDSETELTGAGPRKVCIHKRVDLIHNKGEYTQGELPQTKNGWKAFNAEQPGITASATAETANSGGMSALEKMGLCVAGVMFLGMVGYGLYESGVFDD